RERTRASRLFAIDAGTDLHALRQRYPDRSRYAIVGGTVRAWCACGNKQPHRLRGQINGLHIASLNVPAAWRPALIEEMPRRHDSERLPLRVEVSFGQRLEPWISTLDILQKPTGRDDGGATPR